MIKAGGDERLLIEALQSPGALTTFADELDGNVALEALLMGAIDNPHSAPPDRRRARLA